MKLDEWQGGVQIIISSMELKDCLAKGGMLKEFDRLQEEAKKKDLKVKRVLCPHIPINFFGVPVVVTK